jgi:hypothetical protein
MLLTPEHFRRSDAFSVELFEWLLRYSHAAVGLLGGGPRVPRAERGLKHFDPRVDVADDGEQIHLTVVQARGVTPDGGFVEVSPPRQLRRSVRKDQFIGQNVLTIYVVRTGDDEPDIESAGHDDANPLQPAWVQDGLRIELGVRTDMEGDALAVGRMQRVAETQSFALDAHFIPACATMLAHSELFAGWQRLQSELAFLAGAYGELHRRVAMHIEEFTRRGVDVRADLDRGRFIERAVLAIDSCVYETMDATRAPATILQQVDRCGRQLALALDLSEATRLFLTELSAADADYARLLEVERNALSAGRELGIRSDLRLELQRAEGTVQRLRSLLHALEGRYLDYRINPSVDALQFLIDRDGEQFFTRIASHTQQQMDGNLLTFSFPQLNLVGRHPYRLVILGDPNGRTQWDVGDELRTTLTLNPGTSGSRPESRVLVCDTTAQRNLALDFTPSADVATISALSLAVRPPNMVRGALLYRRVRGEAFSATPVAPPDPRGGTSGSSGRGGGYVIPDLKPKPPGTPTNAPPPDIFWPPKPR